MRYKLLLIAFIFFGHFHQTFSQSKGLSTIDSLKDSFQKASDKKKKVDLLNQLGYEFRKTENKDSSIFYTDRAVEITNQFHYPQGEILATLNYAITYRELKKYSKAKEYSQTLIRLCEVERDSLRLGDAFDNLAHIYFEEGDTHKALINHFSALRIREKTGDNYGSGNSYDNIAHIYSSQYRYEDALKYFMRSFKTFKKVKDLSRETLSLANVGLQLYRQGNYPAALL